MNNTESIYTHYGVFKQYILLQLTLKCTLKCTHCIVEAGMNRTEEMSTKQAVTWLREIVHIHEIEVVVLTGGEPFLDLRRLSMLLSIAHNHGLEVSIVTSCLWAKSYDTAIKVLSGLPPIANLSISTDQYHLDFVTLEQIKHTIRAAQSLNIEVGIFICLENSKDNFLEKFQKEMGNEIYESVKIFRQYVHLTGRAKQVKEIANNIEKVTFKELKSEVCKAVYAPIILADGNVMACCGDAITDTEKWKALSLGNVNDESLRDIYKRYESNHLIHALRIFGPKELAEIALEKIDSTLMEKSYEKYNICDICSEVCTNPKITSYLKKYLEK